MSKNIMEQATNKINIVGKLLDTTFREGKTSAGQVYESCNFTVRVTQTYGGREETSEIPVSIFATQYTSQNKPHPGYKNIQEMKKMKTVQDYGEAEATVVRMTSANIRENNFVARSGQLINGWQINTSFLNEGKMADIASFNMDIFIMDMHEEVDREGEPTGRLVIKGAVVQYGGRLDVIEFIVEDNDAVNYISRNWEENKTVNVGGRIRVTSQEEKRSASESSWGEELPETSTRMVRELIITRGSDEPFDEDFAYDAVEIKKAFNERKARLEQMQVDAKKGGSTKSATTSAAPGGKFSWE
jgi:hypothetical protein